MGIDLDRFVDEPDEDFHCPVCFGAAWLPYVVCSEDDHLLCAECCDEILSENNPTCPKCRRAFLREVSISKLGKRLLEKCHIHCRNNEAGCDWQGPISEEITHATTLCLQRLVECPDCHKEHTLASKVEHSKSCPDKWVHCPRGGKNCGEIFNAGLYRRKHTFQHDALCTQYRCKNFGTCRTRTTRANLVKHEEACISQIARIVALEGKVSALERQKRRRQNLPSSDEDSFDEVITLSDEDEGDEEEEARERPLANQPKKPAFRPAAQTLPTAKRIKPSTGASAFLSAYDSAKKRD
ncbi:hypothetical protein JCM11251_002543 [Rhodosporidiobolus azoricus]